MMIQRFVRDQSGMTMALSMMMILLIGVMGAGLLVFAQSDLNSVLQVNKGQSALDIADAGVQAAKGHLRVDSFRQHYDTNRANDCAEGPRVGGDNWSKATDIYTDPDGKCEGPSTRTDNTATPWPEHYGVTKEFAGGRFHVTIECYTQGDTVCDGGAGTAPEAVSASDRKFFKITSTGYDTPTGDGAIRKIEAIYFTQKRTYAPIAYWTPKNINFSGTQCVRRLSFFAGGNITNVVRGNACGSDGTIADRATPALYGDWYASLYNTTRRVNASGTPVTGAGFGAIGRVCGGSQCNTDANSIANGYNDYDRTTGLKGQQKTFVGTAPVPTPTNQITFPFEEGNALTDPSTIVDPGLVEEMAAAAGDQGNYHSATGTWRIDTADWPAQGGKSITYFVDGVGGAVSVDFRVNTGNNQPLAKGVIVVRNGDFTFSNSSNGFEGVIIIIGNGTTTGRYTQAGGIQLDGYVAASGNMTISGNVMPSTTIDFTNLNSFYDVSLWSWRELYQ